MLPGLSFWHTGEAPGGEGLWSVIVEVMAARYDRGGPGERRHVRLSCHPVRPLDPAGCVGMFDLAHGSWRDIQACIREVGLYQWLLLRLICENLAHGPVLPDLRHPQIKDAMAECARLHTHDCCALARPMIADQRVPLEESAWA